MRLKGRSERCPGWSSFIQMPWVTIEVPRWRKQQQQLHTPLSWPLSWGQSSPSGPSRMGSCCYRQLLWQTTAKDSPNKYGFKHIHFSTGHFTSTYSPQVIDSKLATQIWSNKSPKAGETNSPELTNTDGVFNPFLLLWWPNTACPARQAAKVWALLVLTYYP